MKHKIESTIIFLVFLFIVIQITSFTLIFLAMEDKMQRLEQLIGSITLERK